MELLTQETVLGLLMAPRGGEMFVKQARQCEAVVDNTAIIFKVRE